MDIYQLQVFSSVYRLRSFSRASEELHITQPAVSMHIKRLEEDLGIRLFDRSGQKTIPTKEAVVLHERAEELISKLNDIKDDLRQEKSDIEGLLTIGTSSSTGAYMIPFIAAEFQKLHPKVFFQLVVKGAPEIYRRLISGELPVGVVEDKKEREGIVVQHSIIDEMVLVAAPEQIKKKVITPLGIFRIPLLMREDDSDARKSMEKQHMLHNIALKGLNVVAILGSTDSLKEAVKAGLGAAIISRFAVKGDLEAGLLEEIRIRGVKMKRPLYVVSNKNRTLPRIYQSFLLYLKDKLPSS
ncbi:MAG: LysR family transcriptional regulator [Nitrospirae bacterium]|nr:LysR family transcriptional regulator [Nitrospirota bacterium]